MSSLNLEVNGQAVQLQVDSHRLLVEVLREQLGLTGTKYGCGMALCGACTIHLDGTPVRACTTPLSAVAGKKITTIEGIGASKTGAAVQAAWLQAGVPQCGYCQAGQIMSAVALLKEKPTPTDEDIATAMTGNLCRCGTYVRIRAAIKEAAAMKGLPMPPKGAPESDRKSVV